MTAGMGWSRDGGRLYVLTEVRREIACRAGNVAYAVVVVELESGDVVEAAPGEEARRRWPTLPWSPVTVP